jgi:hypothetical protein
VLRGKVHNLKQRLGDRNIRTMFAAQTATGRGGVGGESEGDNVPNGGVKDRGMLPASVQEQQGGEEIAMELCEEVDVGAGSSNPPAGTTAPGRPKRASRGRGA